MVRVRLQIFQFLGLNPTGDVGPFTFYTKTNFNRVYYLKAPPTKPPTDWQQYNLDRWAYFAETFHDLPAAEQTKWQAAAIATKLRISGWNLWFWYCTKRDLATIATIERQSGITLAKPFDP